MKRSVSYRIMCLVVASTMATSSWVAAQEKKIQVPELNAWKEVDSLSKQSLQEFLKKFPNGELATEAKVAIELDKRITDIREGKPNADFVITFAVLGNYWKDWQERNPDKGVVGYFAEKGEKNNRFGWFTPVPFSGGKTGRSNRYSFDGRGISTSPTGDGSIVAFGTGGLKFELFKGFVFETPGDEPMYFGVIEGKGLVHLKGTGKVSLPDGKTRVLK